MKWLLILVLCGCVPSFAERRDEYLKVRPERVDFMDGNVHAGMTMHEVDILCDGILLPYAEMNGLTVLQSGDMLFYFHEARLVDWLVCR